jgi:ATP-binding cassette, subfamily B (MDR/TAP), member 1
MPPKDDVLLGAFLSSSKKDSTFSKTDQASISEMLQFVFDCGPRAKGLFCIGCFASIPNGLVYPALAYLFSSSFSNITGSASNGLGAVKKLAFSFMGVGVYALVVATIQSWTLEYNAFYASNNFRKQWFEALLHQIICS